MQFTTVTALATLALALPAIANPVPVPAPVEVTDITPRGTINEAEVFAITPLASCSILSCISVIEQAVCITDAIEADDYTAILKCAKKKELCGCAGCFKKLNGFLEKWGIC
ncbi:hypothetical protein B0T20DRAFT_389313 [Sordaria brevicollis]|uniref:Fungal calcium binding protein domain-containing protein n=1 Tax=Sordaria brevicollis TaxID=83679 RepID=A0AAE0PJV2_SORBR|nr:hypothetical protein B0T20DRAFT_389313 [Sordaria brevicollis]